MNNVATFKKPKTERSSRVVALSPSTIEVLRDHRHQQDKVRHDLELPATSSNNLIFCDINGLPLRPDTVSHAWKKLARKCGLNDIHTHSAWHSHASILLRQGVNVKIISERLGHTSTSFTVDIYAHSVKTLQKDAANGFDALFAPNLHQTTKSPSVKTTEGLILASNNGGRYCTIDRTKTFYLTFSITHP